MSAKAKGFPYRVQVLDRALGILDLLSTQGPELAPAELSGQLVLHKSTLHRLLQVLEQHRLVDKNPRNGKYRLGLKLFEFGTKAVAQLDLRERVRPYLERLVYETGETAHMCILDRGEMLSLANVESPRTVRTPSTVGHRIPFHCTAAGKAVLAFVPESELNELLKSRNLKSYTRNTITSPVKLKAELQLIRRRGYAVDNEEIEDGLKCIAAPIKDYSGKVMASISIAGPVFRITRDKASSMARSVMEAADQLSTELGYRQAHTPKKDIKVITRLKTAR